MLYFTYNKWQIRLVLLIIKDMDKLKQLIYNLLKKSEKLLKTDVIYLAKNGFWTFGENVLTTALGLSLSVAFANLLPKESFGTYKFMISLADLTALLALTGMASAVTQAVARGFEGALKSGFIAHLKWNIFMFLFSLGGVGYYFLNGNNTLAIAFLFIGALYPITRSASLYNAFLSGKKEFKLKMLLGVFRAAVVTTAMVVTILITDSPLAIFFVYLAVHAITVISFFLFTLKKYKPKKDTDTKTVSFGRHLSFMNILTKLSTTLESILVFHYLGAVQLAVYSFALSPVKQIGSLSGLLSDLALPKLSARPLEELKQSIWRKTLVLFTGLAVIVTVYIILAPYLFKFLFPQYMESVAYSQILILTLLLPGTLIGGTFVAHAKKKQLYIQRITIPLLKIILLFVLLPIYGVWGAAIAILATATLNFLLNSIMFTRL